MKPLTEKVAVFMFWLRELDRRMASWPKRCRWDRIRIVEAIKRIRRGEK